MGRIRSIVSPVRGLGRRIGFRGATLLLLALVDFAYARTFIHPDPGQEIANRYLSAAMPFSDPAISRWTWALAWWITGLFCLVNAFRRNDRWGYGMAVALKVAYVLAILYGGTLGMPNASTRGVVWTFIAAWVLIESRRAEPHRDIGEVAREMEETGEIPKPEGGDA